MKKFFYNMTSGAPRSLIFPSVASLMDGIAKILPAAMILQAIGIIYEMFASPETPPDFNSLWLVCGILAGWMIIQYLASALAYDQTFTAAYNASANGRTALAEHLRRLSLGFLGSRDPGEITTMLLSDYAAVEQAISHQVPQLVSAVALPLIAFISLLFVNWQMAIAMFVALPLTILTIALTNRFQVKLSKKHIKAKVDAASRLQEYLYGMREIKAHNLSGPRFARLEEAFRRLKRESIRLEGLLGPIMMAAIGLLRTGLTLMILVGSSLLVGGQLTLPVFLVFLLLGTRIYEPMTVVLTSYAELKYAAVGAARIMEIRHEQPLPGTTVPPTSNVIEFDRVTFAYDDTAVLKDLSFTIRPRTITALVGPSGSGKSTVTRLIARFWDVQGGRVLLGGQDIRQIDPEQLLERVSMVFQDVYLFKDTIAGNIRVGNMNATQEEIERAAKQACCHDFIMQLPMGYDTPVGEGGCTLSGGEKQRISIARALLKNAPIVLLDEATASLDPENETQVQRALNALVADKTVVIIAHRLKTVRGADNIIVLEDGHLAEQGRHAELLKKNGLYKRLWTLQQQTSGWSMKAS